MNICGCLVNVRQQDANAVRCQIAEIPGVEVHAATEDGRIVVVVEDTETDFASDTIMALHQVPGVISLTINFHHFEHAGQRPQPANSQSET